MWCPACGWVIEETLKRISGTVHSVCDFFTDTARCRYDPSLTSPSRIIGAIEGLGYRISIPGEERESDEKRREFIRFVVSAFLTTNVMMLSFALYSGFFTELTPDAIRNISWPILFMTTVVLFYGGKRIFQRAWAGMTSPVSGMETLIAAGSFSAYAYSTHNLFSGNIHLYYDTACMLITLFLLGKTLERRAKKSIQRALSSIWSLQPTKVRISSDVHSRGRYVSIKQLKPGDLFRMQEDEDVPADGLIIEGNGLVDESSLTGEATPVPKKSGHRLLSGTRIMQGAFTVRADGIGEDSTVGQMAKIMEKALGTKTHVEGKTDRLLRYFVPAVLILAAGTGMACYLFGVSSDQAMLRAVTVMVISCPCALGLAIPLARVAGISLSGKRGILVGDFSAFERAQQVDAFVFDKTGTVTAGEWSLLQVVPFDSFTERQVLCMAASLEKTSEHYIAMEIKKEAEKRDLTLVDIENIEAFENGVSGNIETCKVKIGSHDFLSEEIERSATAELESIPARDSIGSAVFMSYDGRLCAVFVFGDMIKEGALDTVRELLDRQCHVSLISGDGQHTTEVVGRKVGIRSSHGGKLPIDKVAFVEKLQEEGQTVAMIGDGINDAPALVQADLAMAVHSGSHLGEQAADVTLMRGDPRQVLEFLDLGKIVNRKIQQNVLYSSSYNLIGIPIAMSGLLNPLIAVCAMFMSSLSVLGNSLLLLKRRPER
jgi:heavy metal translocating P-type ATPase